ncbi:MAG: NfeD family protein [Bacteroidales bacterium]|jgi:membrane-bound ClpP family serine protease|nr:hypothetical protein [Bacteroidales bacterium]MDD4394695.1 NfeD family protein [Bacteroidales bacterium]
MNWAVVISLIVFGLIALILEILVIPGGVVGILGLLSITAGIIISYVTYGTTAGNITLAITLVVIIVSSVAALRSKTWRKLMLDTKLESKMNDFDEQRIKVGAVGTTLSRLAPSGKAIFDGEIVEVTSSQTFINENEEILIIKIDGNKIIVKTKN